MDGESTALRSAGRDYTARGHVLKHMVMALHTVVPRFARQTCMVA